MKRRQKEYIPYNDNENIHVFYELNFKKDVIKPGDKIVFKNVRGVFFFQQFVTNSKLDVQWIDCREMATMQYRSFYVDRLKGVYRAKKRIRKKLV